MSKLINNPVDHPSHYTTHSSGIEAIVLCEQLNFCLGNAFKYLFRFDRKWNPTEDLKKSIWYIDRERYRQSPWLWTGQKLEFFLDLDWETDKIKLNPEGVIYKVIGANPGNIEKAMFYIWAAQYSFGTILEPLAKAKCYVELEIKHRESTINN